MSWKQLGRKIAEATKFVSSKPSHPPLASPGISKVFGARTPEPRHITTSDLLDETATLYPELNAIISDHQDFSISFGDLNKKVSDVATNLYDHGFRKDDRVAISAGNVWEYVVFQMALARLGAILVPLNSAFVLPQYERALSRTHAKGLIIQSHLSKGKTKPEHDTSELIEKLIKSHPELSIFSLAHHKLGQNRTVEQQGRVWDAGQLLENTRPRTFDTAPDEVTNMQFTSGTTSDPKISCLTHYNLVNNAILCGNGTGLSATKAYHPLGQDHVCVPVPMFHCFGLVLNNLVNVATGSCSVFACESFDPAKTLKAVAKYDCTGLHGVPTMFAAELDRRELIPQGGFKYLRRGIAAGSVVPPALMRRMIAELGLSELVIGYGMTETSPLTFLTDPGDRFDKKTTTVGRVMPNSACMIVAPGDATLAPLPIGTRGEILTSGYSLQKGYFEDPVRTDEAMVRDNQGRRWMRTGDEGFLDDEGYLTVTGRIKDMIIRGGENINPQEIENVLFEHPAVNQASVVGVQCDKYGEEIGAFVVLERGATVTSDELRQHVSESLGHYLVPKFIKVTEGLPKTTSGKVRKVELRTQAKGLVGRGEFD